MHQRAKKPEPAEEELYPPELIEYVQAQYPPEAFKAGIEAIVSAEIGIDEKGKVTDVKIVKPVGNGFDESAKAAMEKFIFSPAKRGETPIPSRILYNYRFFISEQKPAEETPEKTEEGRPEEPEPEPVLFRGKIENNKGAGVADANIILVPTAGGEPLAVTTVEGGLFEVPGAAAGEYEVEVAAPGYRPFIIIETVVEDKVTDVVYRLKTEKAEYETVVRADKPPREVTRRTIKAEEMQKAPGTGGDAVKVIQSLPGVARAPGLAGILIIRGSSPSESNTFLDKVDIPLLYHFGGLTSVVNSDFLERIDYIPGNYSARYGDATGGIVDIQTRKLRDDRVHAYIDADLIDIGAFVEGPVSEDIVLAGAVRRSYIDAILALVLPEISGLDLTVAPVYWDYQALGDFKLSGADKLRVFFYGSDDALEAVVGGNVTEDPYFHGDVGFHTQFHRVQLVWDHEFTKKINNMAMINGAYTDLNGGFGDIIQFGFERWGFGVREELDINGSHGWDLLTGVEFNAGWYNYKIRAPMPSPEGVPNEPFDPDNVRETEANQDNWLDTVSVYTEFETRPLEDLRMIYGLRFDYFDRVKEISVNPRFVTRYEVIPGTTLKGGVGLYTGQPSGASTDNTFGNPDLDLTHAIHYGLGAEQRITDFLSISIEGFYKDLHNVVSQSADPRYDSDGNMLIGMDGEPVPERYDNEGIGRIYGGEMWVKYDPDGFFFGWLSYTLMKSERKDSPEDDWRLFDYDQTHVVSLVGSFHLGAGWDIGARFRLTSGNPYTPVQSSIYDSDGDYYFPFYGKTNSERLPLYHQLDIRVDKLWVIDWLKLSLYLDVLNVYVHQNVEGVIYNYDYSEKGYLYGIPIIPSLGVKAEY